MSGKAKFEQQVAEIEKLRELPPESAAPALRKALMQKNNFLAGKAADVVRELRLEALIPDLLAAFERFFDDPVKSDPQCWAKNGLSRALAALEYQEPEVFLRGMRHTQLEPVYGGSADTAGTLRATCAFALVQCRGVREHELLIYLIELMADKEKSVRAEVARAIEQVGSNSAAMLLRLRATLGSDEPEVLGACYGGVLRLEGVRAIPWAAHFLEEGDDAAAEAALAIAGTHSAEGFAALRDGLEKHRDPWFRSVLLSALALTRQDEALEFLLRLVSSESLHAEGAIEAILRSGPPEKIVARLRELVRTNVRLKKAFEAQRRAQS